MMLVWPLLRPRSGRTTQVDPPFVFLALLPVVIVVVLAEVTEGGLDPRVLAVLGVLVGGQRRAARALAPAPAGVELVFFLLILAGRVFGPGFGFVLGCTSLFASALLTAGVGPWLPYQMLVLGLGRDGRRAAAAPGHRPGRDRDAGGVRRGGGVRLRAADEPLVAGRSCSASRCPGHTGLAVRARRPAGRNLHRFLIYTLITSTGSFDTGRAITNAVAIVVLGPAVLTTLRRAARRAVVTGTTLSADPAEVHAVER